MSDDELTPTEIRDAILGKTIIDAYADEAWLGLTLSDGTDIEFQAIWLNTGDTRLVAEHGRRLRDIYGITPAVPPVSPT